MRCWVSTWAVLVLVVAGAISACGGSSHHRVASSSDNGVASRSPEAIVTAAMGAIDRATSVHVAGSIVSGGAPITLDLDPVSGEGGRGAMSESGLSFQVVVLDRVVYINGSQAFWRHYGGVIAALLLHGNWLKAPASGRFAPLGLVSNPRELFSTLLANHGTLAKGATTVVNGRNVVAVNDTTKGGTLYVATRGKPYPVEVVKSGPQGGRIVFDRFNESVSLNAPANAIDISQLPFK
jgi:hypothetical protein